MRLHFPCRLIGLLGGLFGFAAPDAPVSAQPTSPQFRPYPVYDYVVDVPGHTNGRLFVYNAESNNLDVKRKPQVGPSELRYLYLPAIHFQQVDGKIQVENKDGLINLPLRFDVANARGAIAKHLADKIGPEVRVSEGQVLPVNASRLVIQTPPGYSPYIKLFDQPFQFKPTEVLTVQVLPEEAKKFVQDLQERRVGLNVSFAMAGYESKAENVATITFADVAKTRAFQSLKGKGRQGYLSRDQVRRVFSESVRELSVDIVRSPGSDDEFDKLLAALIGNLSKKQETFDNDWKKLGDLMNDYGYQAKEIAPDLRTRFDRKQKDTLKKSFYDAVDEHIKEKGSGGGGVDIFGIQAFGGGGGEEERKLQRTILQEYFKENDIHVTEEGETIIPKGMDVYAVNEGLLNNTGTMSVRSRMRLDGVGIAHFSVHPQVDVVDTKAIDLIQDRLAALELKLPAVAAKADLLERGALQALGGADSVHEPLVVNNDHPERVIQMKKTITFASPFREKPTVVVGLSRFAGDSKRLIHVKVVAVETTHFELLYEAHNGNPVGTVGANWIAVGLRP